LWFRVPRVFQVWLLDFIVLCKQVVFQIGGFLKLINFLFFESVSDLFGVDLIAPLMLTELVNTEHLVSWCCSLNLLNIFKTRLTVCLARLNKVWLLTWRRLIQIKYDLVTLLFNWALLLVNCFQTFIVVVLRLCNWRQLFNSRVKLSHHCNVVGNHVVELYRVVQVATVLTTEDLVVLID